MVKEGEIDKMAIERNRLQKEIIEICKIYMMSVKG